MALPKTFLDKFLTIIAEHGQAPDKFSISLTSSSAWLKMSKKNFKRYIHSGYAQDRGPTGFVEGKHFVYVPTSPKKAELFMTLDTFQKAAGRTRGTWETGRTLRVASRESFT